MTDDKPIHVLVAEAMSRPIRRGHYVGRRWERLNSLIAEQPDENGNGCWIWHGSKRALGYGAFKIDGVVYPAHRLLYMLAKGPIPDGMEIDHLCRVPACVNPDHLEAVTHRVNVQRGKAPSALRAKLEVCARGHRYDYRKRNGKRHCRECQNLRQRERYQPRPRGKYCPRNKP